MTVATAGPGGLLQRADRAARPARAGPVRVHDPALGRDRRRDRGRARRRVRADAAAGGPGHPRAAGRSPRAAPDAVDAGGRSRTATDGAWARLAQRVMRHPVAVLIPTLALPARARLAVPARPVQRPGRVDPAAGRRRRARPSTGSSAEFGEGEFAPIVRRHPDRRPGDRRRPTSAALYDWSRRLAADPRVARVDSLVDVDPRLSLRAVRSCSTPTRTGRATATSQTALAATTTRRPDRVHADHPLRPEPRRGTRAGRRPARRRAAPLAPPAGMTVLVGGGAAEVTDVVDRVARRLPAHGAVHHRLDLPRPVRAPPLGRAAGQGAGR